MFTLSSEWESVKLYSFNHLRIAECQQKVMELWANPLWLNFTIPYNVFNIYTQEMVQF